MNDGLHLQGVAVQGMSLCGVAELLAGCFQAFMSDE